MKSIPDNPDINPDLKILLLASGHFLADQILFKAGQYEEARNLLDDVIKKAESLNEKINTLLQVAPAVDNCMANRSNRAELQLSGQTLRGFNLSLPPLIHDMRTILPHIRGKKPGPGMLGTIIRSYLVKIGAIFSRAAQRNSELNQDRFILFARDCLETVGHSLSYSGVSRHVEIIKKAEELATKNNHQENMNSSAASDSTENPDLTWSFGVIDIEELPLTHRHEERLEEIFSKYCLQQG